MHVELRIPATTANIGPGFDVFGAALKLYNKIIVDTTAARRGKSPRRIDDILNVEIKAGNEAGAPQSFRGLKDLVRRTVLAAAGEFGLGKHILKKFGSINVKMINYAPLARGMGSSASAITGAVHAVKVLGGIEIPAERLLSLACRLEGHPDNITPAFYGGICISVEQGGRFEYIKLEMPGDLAAVLCVPDFGMSTDAARRLLPSMVSFRDAVFNASRTALLVSAILKKEYRMLKTAMEDRLHQPYRKKLIPGFDEVIVAAKKAGAYGAALSGSGSTILEICPNKRAVCERIGRAMTGTFMKRRLGSRYIICGFDNEGVKQLK